MIRESEVVGDADGISSVVFMCAHEWHVLHGVRGLMRALLLVFLFPCALLASDQVTCIAVNNELAAFPFKECVVSNRSTCEPIAEVVWRKKCGICGEKTCAMMVRLKQMGIETRYVGMFGLQAFGVGNATHAMVEARYNGKWHLFCPSFGVYFTGTKGEVLSLRDMLTNPKAGKAHGPEKWVHEFRNNFFRTWTSVAYGDDERDMMFRLMKVR